MDQQQVDAEVEFLRKKLNEMATRLGVNHSGVLKLSQELDEVINLAQRRWQIGDHLDNKQPKTLGAKKKRKNKKM